MLSLHRFARTRSFRTVTVLFLLLSLAIAFQTAGAQSPVAEPVTGTQTGELAIITLSCPVGFDPGAGSVQDALDTCTQLQSGMSYTLSSQDPAYPGAPRTTDTGGTTGWTDIPAGVPFTIARATPEGMSDPWVYCRLYQELDESGPSIEFFTAVPGGVLDIGGVDPTLTGYKDATCYWFDLPYVAPGARVDIRGWQCPFHYDLQTASPDQLFSVCNRPLRSIGYILNGDESTRKAAGDLGSVSFQDVPYGTLTIQQEAWGSYDAARVFCYTLPATASHGPIQASQEIAFTAEPNDTFSVTLQVDPGEAVDCVWFDAWVTEETLGTVLVTAYQCPDGYDPQSGGVNDLLMTCHTPQASGYFELALGGGSSGNQTDANGFIGFINYTPATYTLTETAPIGWSTERVFCRSTQADDWNHPTDPYVEYPVSNKTGISVTLTAHWETDCLWFDSKGVDHAFLDINTWSCPLDFAPDEATPRDTFAQTCTVGVSGAAFEVDRGFGFELTGTSTGGYVFFQEPVPYGTLDIRGSGPNTHQFLRGFCGDAPYIGIGAIPSLWTSYQQPYLTFPAQVNYQVVCEFYYVPLTSASDAAASPSAETAAETDEAVVASPVTVAEANPTAEPNTSPEDGSDASQPAATPAIVNAAGGSAGSAQTGMQPEAGAPATLLLNVHTCPAGYDVYAQNANPASDCTVSTGPPAVTVNGAASETSADGMAGWTGLPAGAAYIEAEPGSFLGTCTSDVRTISADSVFVPYVFANPAGTIGVSLLAGETLTCDWYSLGIEASGTISVTLFDCPGPTVIVSQCGPAAGPASLHFESIGDAGASFDLTIDESGSCQISATGVYRLAGFPAAACSIESDAFDATGSLIVEPGGTAEVRIYLCRD